ncbi:hypothetical protein HK405_001208, partial [Cladochytrium tenue]
PHDRAGRLALPPAAATPPVTSPADDTRSIAVFSGGTAANAFVSMLQAITDNVCYILPVSDDGGSTSEIARVVGGPGIGDIRSRLVRLAETGTAEARAVHRLLSHRLPAGAGRAAAQAEWQAIVEGRHALWRGISAAYRETIRAFLLQFHMAILRRAGSDGGGVGGGGGGDFDERDGFDDYDEFAEAGTADAYGGGGSGGGGGAFDFRGGSVGNFFLTGGRLFFRSLDAAIFQFARATRVAVRTRVVPAVETGGSERVAIAAALRDGSVVVGQCEISHPGVADSSGGGHGDGHSASHRGS